MTRQEKWDRREFVRFIAEWVSDFEAMEANLTAVQTRCTELLEENRALRKRIENS